MKTVPNVRLNQIAVRLVGKALRVWGCSKSRHQCHIRNYSSRPISIVISIVALMLMLGMKYEVNNVNKSYGWLNVILL